MAKNAINKAKVDSFIEKPWYKNDLASTILSTLARKNENKNWTHTQVDNVKEALDVIQNAKAMISNNNQMAQNKQILILEFKSSADFNNFSFKIQNMKNVAIDDVEIFENKYIVKLGIYLDSFEAII
jgi:hypothetical protein